LRPVFEPCCGLPFVDRPLRFNADILTPMVRPGKDKIGVVEEPIPFEVEGRFSAAMTALTSGVESGSGRPRA